MVGEKVSPASAGAVAAGGRSPVSPTRVKRGTGNSAPLPHRIPRMRGIPHLGCATLLLLISCGGDRPERGTLPPLHYLATADQAGPVAYRDPVGAISPDGNWLASLERGQIRFAPAAGGAAQRIGPGTASIRYLTWFPDSRRVLVHENVFDRSRQEWWVYDRADGSRSPLWPDRPADAAPATGALGQLSWSVDGSAVAGVTREDGISTLWVLGPTGGNAAPQASGGNLSFPAWSPDGQIACLVRTGQRQHLHLPCSAPEPLFDEQEAYGRIAFSPDGEWVIYGVPGEGGFLDLWMRRVSGGRRTRLTRFARDAYSPSAGAGGEVVFKSQDYRVFLATAPADGGPSEPLTAFQSETPTWSPDGSEIAFTYGSWRHVTDDIHYPDIAQHLGTVPVSVETPHREPRRVVRQSYSEDQGMQWSPNGRWIVFHTHEESDDIWLMAADGSGARQISEDGHETGWARWSPDGRFVVFTSYRRDRTGARHGGLYVIGVDQETGEVTARAATGTSRGFRPGRDPGRVGGFRRNPPLRSRRGGGQEEPLDGVPRGRRAGPLPRVRVGPDPLRDRGLAGRPLGGLHRPRRRRLLPGVPGPAQAVEIRNRSPRTRPTRPSPPGPRSATGSRSQSSATEPTSGGSIRSRWRAEGCPRSQAQD